jgi:hypothetical protein
MVHATQVRLGHNLALRGRLDRSRNRRVPIQREMRAGFMVIGEELRQSAAQMVLVEYDHVVQALL